MNVARAFSRVIPVLSATVVAGLLAIPGSAAGQTCTYRSGSIPEKVYSKYVPNHTRGDRDFAGHGPDVTIEAKLLLSTNSSGGTTITLERKMFAEETRSDWTTVSGTRRVGFFTTPAGYRLQSLVDANGQPIALVDTPLEYVDTDHADDVYGPQYPGTFAISFVRRYQVTGDTAGDEAGSRTGFVLSTRGMTVHSRKCT